MSFFIQAHQDDWQVHMGANAYGDLASGGKVVLIFTTAGDAGREDTWWMTREKGARASVEIGVNAGPGGAGASWSSSIATYNGHATPKFEFGNCVCYFMRLPDGGNGSGFPKYGNQSLMQLHISDAQMKAVDRDDTYISWNDFLGTLIEIFVAESQGMPTNVWHNAVTPDLILSGHYDHIHTALAVSDAAGLARASLAARGQIERIAFFKGSGRPIPPGDPQDPLPPPDADKPKRLALFNAYEASMRAVYGEAGTTRSENPRLIDSWIGNQDPPQLVDV